MERDTFLTQRDLLGPNTSLKAFQVNFLKERIKSEKNKKISVNSKVSYGQKMLEHFAQMEIFIK